MNTKVIPVVLALVCIVAAPLVGPAAELCSNNNQCSGSDACIGGACVPAVPDPFAYATTAMTRWSSYVWAVQFPALFEPAERCCFDYTGDGIADDSFGAMLGLMASFPSYGDTADVELKKVLENGTLVKVFDWRELAPDLVSGDVQLSVFDGEWTDPTIHADRIDGSGHVAFLLSSFGPYGALDQLNAGTVTTGLVDVTGNQFTLTLPLMLTGELVTFHLLQPRLEATVAYGVSPPDTCLGLCSVNEDRGGGHTPQIVGGAKLGGVITADEMLTHLDATYRQCACAGVDPSSPVLVWQENEGTTQFEISCTGNTGDPSGCLPSDPCSNLATTCSTISLFGSVLDVDQDGNSIPDGFSIGLRLGFSGTTLDPIPVLFYDYFESGDTSKWSFAVP